MNTPSRADEQPTVVVPIQDRVRGKTERLEADFCQIGTRIHRFPPGLRGIGGPDGRYIAPSVVALGPYHHGSRLDLQEMEELKHATAHYFCAQSDHQAEQVYGRILSIAERAGDCYDEDAMTGLSHSQFAEMMFLDGCFLLMYIDWVCKETCPSLINSMFLSTGSCLLRDIMLLENQLPWLVLEVLMTFKHVDVHSFIASHIRQVVHVTDRPEPVFPRMRLSRSASFKMFEFEDFGNYGQPHFLALARFHLIASMPEEKMIPVSSHSKYDVNMATLSAIKLSEMGVKLKPSKASWFADMSVSKNCGLFSELLLSPVFLNDVTACWLVNMAALEARTSTKYPSDGCLVSSYLSLLAVVMNKEEDVHELRARHIVIGVLSNKDTLEFFKLIARHLRLGYRYFAISGAIEHYRRERRLWIAIHRFLYNNWKTIATLISIAGVLVGIFKALYSLKGNYP